LATAAIEGAAAFDIEAGVVPMTDDNGTQQRIIAGMPQLSDRNGHSLARTCMRARIELLKNFGPVPTVSSLTLRRYAAGHAGGAAAFEQGDERGSNRLTTPSAPNITE
jgi:hypothetical protein